MDIDKLAQSAVEVVATHLAQWGTDAADRLADEGINQIYQLILSRLRRTSVGLGMLNWLQQDPADEHRRAAVTQVVTGEARNDPEFAESLGQAVQRAGILVQGAGASYRSGDNTVEFQNIVTQGDVRIGHRQFHIGRLQFGTGGLATGIIALVVLLGGGTAAVVSATAETTPNTESLSSAVGRWEQPGYQQFPGFERSATTLTISSDGSFTLSAGVKMGTAESPADNFLVECSGTVEPTEGSFTFRTTTGSCSIFVAALSSDGRTIDVVLVNGPILGLSTLTRVGS